MPFMPFSGSHSEPRLDASVPRAKWIQTEENKDAEASNSGIIPVP